MRRRRFADGYLDEVERLSKEIARIEPWLERASHPPMTFMLIPSILASADRVLRRLAAYRGPRADEARALHARLWLLRQRFDPRPAANDRAATN